MKPLVEFCASNASSYTQSVIEALEQDPDLDVDVVEYGCLGHCGECYMGPYALVNGDFVSAATAEELLEKIKAKIREDEEAFGKDFPF
ncbi:YuzB family protein [Brevibacillus sp. B_LB10_24]|uniref:YuzB family protein n=1 Tax=Brevibacillus sp. B_LB10_24 TaxID=3380645 RepID=UPI0038BC3ED8